MKQYKMSDVVNEISERENNPSSSSYARFVGLEHYVSGDIEIDNFGSTQKLDSAMKVFHSGDILVARRNVYLRRASVVSFDGLTSGDSIVLRPTDASVARLLPFILNTDQFWDYANQHADGSMSKRLSPKTLMQFGFSLPDEPEQEKYSQILWAMARAKKAYRELLLQTDELVKSQFIEMFGGDKYPSKSLSAVSVVSSGLTKNAKRANFPIKMPYLRVANVLFNKLDLLDIQKIGVLESEIEKCRLQENDLLFVEGNGSPDQIGRVSLWDGSVDPMLHQNHIIKARFCPSKILPVFAMHYFMTNEGREQILNSATTTSGLYTLSLSKIAGFQIPVPPVDNQMGFVRFVEQSDKSKFELKKSLESLDTMQKALVADMFQCHM